MSEELEMSEDLWATLSDTEKEAWQQIQNTLASPGYKLIQRDLSETAEAISQRIFNAENWDQYIFMRGQLDILRVVLGTEHRVLLQLNEAVNERTAESEEFQVSTPEESFI